MSRSAFMLKQRQRLSCRLRGKRERNLPSCVDLEDLFATFEIWQAEFDFTIDSSGTEQRWVQRIRSVGSHDDPEAESAPCIDERRRDLLDVTSVIESIQLHDQFQHGSLHFVVAACTVVKSRATLSRRQPGPKMGIDTAYE